MTSGISSEKASGVDPETPIGYWLREIEEAKEWHSKFKKRGEDTTKRYRDERRDDVLQSKDRQFNVLWSNIETLKPAVYAQQPRPEVGRRFKDEDKLGRITATILERCLEYCNDSYDFDQTIRQCRDDYLLVGRGQTWVSWDAELGEDGYVDNEKAKADYVNWTDYLHNPARTADEVTWVAKRAFLSRSALVRRFAEKGEKVPLDHKTNRIKDEDPLAYYYKKAVVWEIWDSETKQRIYISESYKEDVLEAGPPPVNFHNFFPCPRPLCTVTASDKYLPFPDYEQYKDQAEELDHLTTRITGLIRALRVRGVYDASFKSLQKLLQDGGDNQLIPVESWASFAQTGGLKGAFDLVDITMISNALLQCYEARDRIKADLYEITGLSDIVRGASDPSETATAQQLKSQWGSLRVRDRQSEIQRFVRDIMRLKAEIIAEKFDQKTLAEMSGMQLMTAQQKAMADQQAAMQAMQTGQPPPPPSEEPTWDDVMGLLRNDRLRRFKVGIETDSTIYADEMAEKQARTEFVQAVTQFVAATGPVVQQAPALAPMFSEMLLFAVRAFKAGEQLEDVIEQSIQAASQTPPPGNQEAEVQQQELEVKKQEIAIDRELGLQDNQLRAAEIETQRMEMMMPKETKEAA